MLHWRTSDKRKVCGARSLSNLEPNAEDVSFSAHELKQVILNARVDACVSRGTTTTSSLMQCRNVVWNDNMQTSKYSFPFSSLNFRSPEFKVKLNNYTKADTQYGI